MMGYGANTIVNKLIGLIVFIAIVVGFSSTLLVYFGNLSTSGIALAGVVATLLGILLGVFVLKGGIQLLR